MNTEHLCTDMHACVYIQTHIQVLICLYYIGQATYNGTNYIWIKYLPYRVILYSCQMIYHHLKVIHAIIVLMLMSIPLMLCVSLFGLSSFVKQGERVGILRIMNNFQSQIQKYKGGEALRDSAAPDSNPLRLNINSRKREAF